MSTVNSLSISLDDKITNMMKDIGIEFPLKIFFSWQSEYEKSRKFLKKNN